MKTSTSEIWIFIVIGIVVGGWITNIVNLINNPNPISEWVAYNIMEVIGIFVAPLGVVLGIISWF